MAEDWNIAERVDIDFDLVDIDAARSTLGTYYEEDAFDITIALVPEVAEWFAEGGVEGRWDGVGLLGAAIAQLYFERLEDAALFKIRWGLGVVA